ncbi:MAG: tripartite tricarboxylate transporter substrate binding protein [Burkholderiales bacterium]|nr:tripartite tricarboxylate transporter substrate binding protein [Burkholderiales bacterium]
MNMNRRHFIAGMAGLAAVGPGAALGQERYPARTVTIIVSTSAGGSADVPQRVIAEIAQSKLGSPVIVENRPGAGSAIGLTQLARAAPDGYTFGQISASPVTVTPHFQTIQYDPLASFEYIGQYMVLFTPLSVRADSPLRDFQDLVDFGRKHPGKLRWSVTISRGAAHIATLAGLQKLGVEATFVPQKGASEVLTALLAGDIEFMVTASFGPPLAAGQIRLLAESGTAKIPSMPNLPTYKELGFPFSQSLYVGFAAPAGVPRAIARRWETLLEEICAMPAFVDTARKFHGSPSFLSGRDFAAQIRRDYQTVGELVPRLGFRR